ncbi:hypothetical protein [Candidatus Solirubrobacter pratensis]|uniref:hypothetical protein n=1 Tax=Candidatus Solirubrobacter pratensis TaxID=1298857 RepID=UPI0003F52EFE|nr:hypothetical protein [Candidatus Solirubrobacter pratensis]
MHTSLRRCLRAGAAAALGSAALAAPAAAQGPTLSADSSTDSIIATGIANGTTTLQALRRDPTTGNPVVIGQYTANANPYLPFTVNTTTPTALNPGGDCWQPGKLSLPGGAGLTPDLLPGDTIVISPNGPSAVVPPDGSPAAGSGGPIPGCTSLEVFARNAITGAAGGGNSAVTVSGITQPLASGVTVGVTDGKASTPAATATLAGDGTWSATFPLSQLSGLADGTLTLNAVYAVPDVATGAGAHIGGVPMTLTKRTVGGAVSVTPGAGGGATPSNPAAPALRLTGLRTASTIKRTAVRRKGIRVSFIVPTGATVVRVTLSRAGKTVYGNVFKAGKAGARQTVRLKSPVLARRIKRGTYRLSAAAGPSRANFGVSRAVTVHVR